MTTFLETLQASLATATRSADGIAPPVCVLWTDTDGQWASLMPALRAALPQLLTVGNIDPGTRTGPVIWLKCMIARTLADAPPADVIPVVYLPGVSRQTLRAGGDCPLALQPLIELQYRGAVWHQKNGRDWTVEAFLSSESGCGLDIAQDARTREALLRALPALAAEPLSSLRGRRLDAEDFDRMIIGDPVRDLLYWISDPQKFEARSDHATYETFRSVSKRAFDFDPEAGVPAACEALLAGRGGWEAVWRRFSEAPQLYAGVSKSLRGTRPKDLAADPARYPDENAKDEAALRLALQGVADMAHAEARARIEELELSHRARRTWVWARLGESPLATAIGKLARLADYVRSPLGGTSAKAMAADYAEHGWRCDHAALDALTCDSSAADGALIGRVVRALYAPWLDASARHFQELVKTSGAASLARGVAAHKDTCILFADGLRFDVAGMLIEELEARGLTTTLSHRIAPLPTVTATAKPMASPAHKACCGTTADDFAPVITANGQPANAQRLRAEMARDGVEVLEPHEARFAMGASQGGWSEIGKLDEFGHSMQGRMVREIKTEVEAIADRVNTLLNAGWMNVRVVTDHGWLLLPGGLPKVELPAYLAATRWSRCAVVKGESSTAVPTYPWFWNPQVRIASPPGIGAFVAGTEYAHGGVSLQECVVPEIVVRRGEQEVQARITNLAWRGMRLKVSVEANVPGLRVDLRLNWKQAATSIAATAKEVDANGEASLAVADDSHEGAAATVTLQDAGGNVVDYKPTTVGEGG